MKSQKRDRTERAFVRGYHAGIAGKSKSSCPESNEQVKQSWLTGWREGREGQWEGATHRYAVAS